jgi:hydroxymethylpyrimidine pyrophosphatase-like HAD family hydrolase
MAKALNYCVNWQIKWDFKQVAVGDGANDYQCYQSQV